MKYGPRTLVIGGTSKIAAEIIPGLVADSHQLTVLTRRPCPPSEIGLEDNAFSNTVLDLISYDGSHTQDWIKPYDFVISLAPISLTARLLPWLNTTHIRRAIFLSSNNAALLLREKSYQIITQAERLIKNSLSNSVILQPTMIIGQLEDQTLGLLTRKITAGQRLLLPGLDSLHAPINYKDLAQAIRHVIDNHTPSDTYSVSTNRSVTLRQCAAWIETYSSRTAKIYPFPNWLSPIAGQLIPGIRGDQLRRANIDRLPVNPPLPGFVARISTEETLQTLTQEATLPT